MEDVKSMLYSCARCPPIHNWSVSTIFLLIEITLGIVYVKNKMYYMNLVLSLMRDSIFECTGRDPLKKREYNETYAHYPPVSEVQ